MTDAYKSLSLANFVAEAEISSINIGIVADLFSISLMTLS